MQYAKEMEGKENDEKIVAKAVVATAMSNKARGCVKIFCVHV